MTTINLRHFGPADNQTFFDKYLKEDQLFKDLMFYKCEIAPFAGSWDVELIPCIMYLAYIGKTIVHRAVKINHSSVYAVVCAEIFGVALPDSLFLPTVQARTNIITCTKALMLSPNFQTYTTLDFEKYCALYLRTHGVAELPADFPRELDASMITTADIAIFVLGCMAQYATKITSYGTLGVMITSMTSIIKRGTVSESYIDKIRSGISVDIGSCPEISSEAINIFYRRYGMYIDDRNIQNVFDRCIQQLGTKCLRLTLSIQQAVGSGLTCYLTIREALSLYASFNWSSVVTRYPTEWEKFKQAVATVGDNRYWGYRKDIGIAKSTNFKSLGYISKELLIRIAGQNGLTTYGGWPARIPFKKEMDLMLAEYEATFKDDLTEDRATAVNNEIQEIRNTIVRQANPTV